MPLLMAGSHGTHPESQNESVAENGTKARSAETEMKSTASGRGFGGEVCGPSWRGGRGRLASAGGRGNRRPRNRVHNATAKWGARVGKRDPQRGQWEELKSGRPKGRGMKMESQRGDK